MGRLNGKVAIVTGAGAGMGRATALLLAKEGAKVVVADLTPETGEETVRLIKDAGGEATFIKTDISQAKDVQIMVKTAVDTYGKLDIIHNNAGIMAPMDYTTDVVDGSVDKILAVNLSGTLMCIKYAISAMLKSGGGSIINIGSMAALVGMRGTLGYAASKAGIVGVSRVAAVEYAAKNIRVNCICPGSIETDMAKAIRAQDPETFAKFESGIPRGSIGKPEEIAQVVLFLASDESSYVNGATIPVDGGVTAMSLIQMA